MKKYVFEYLCDGGWLTIHNTLEDAQRELDRMRFLKSEKARREKEGGSLRVYSIEITPEELEAFYDGEDINLYEDYLVDEYAYTVYWKMGDTTWTCQTEDEAKELIEKFIESDEQEFGEGNEDEYFYQFDVVTKGSVSFKEGLESVNKYAPQARYDKVNTTQVKIKLNNKTDADILDWLADLDNKQGTIKQVIREHLSELK